MASQKLLQLRVYFKETEKIKTLNNPLTIYSVTGYHLDSRDGLYYIDVRYGQGDTQIPRENVLMIVETPDRE